MRGGTRAVILLGAILAGCGGTERLRLERDCLVRCEGCKLCEVDCKGSGTMTDPSDFTLPVSKQ